ncbi:complex I subunit 5 family protein [Pararhodobacter sp. SW119]|uniref:complex I subunit 5 family protein n=1 Tax=Pararhodobacter sp. SW119 TaxID=2780075 RepID=UPI001AE01C6B|nr:complex I subunit 5 family protein [Pararhodobacter sp. SW119]
MSAIITGSPWPFLVLAWPLLLGLVPLVPAWRALAVRVLPLAPLPALGFAVLGAPGTTGMPDLLLGVELAAVPGGALFLGMTAAVWTAAGWQAALTLERGVRSGILAGFWCVTLAGNLGVFLAADVVTFYVAFAAVSLCAWVLVVHERTEAALAAGRVYIVLAVLGEAALLAGLLIGAQAGDSLQIPAVREALSDAPLGGIGLALLVTGFGIKAGMVPLHVWLPLAHPVAPVPGSAVLSGAIVNAGLIGMLLFLPPGGGWGGLLVGLGFAGAFGAALWGLTQANPKAVLAYSTVSQMGLILALVGAGQSVAFYALHHGLAKGALFLLVGVAMAATGRRRAATLALAGLIALSVAGLPLTGGGLAKAAAKSGLAPALALAVTLSGVTTTLVLGWFLWLLARDDKRAQGQPWGALIAGAGALGLAAVLVPWALWSGATDLPVGYALRSGAVVEALWPMLLGLGVLAVLCRRPVPTQPPGDLLHLLPARAVGWRLPDIEPTPPFGARRGGLRLLVRAARIDAVLSRWPMAGALLVAGVVAFALLLP